MKLTTITILASLFAFNAWGAGYQLRYQGAEAMGTSFASQGTYGNSVSNVYYNPALFLMQDKKQAIAIEGMAIIPFSAEFESSVTGTTVDDFADTGFSGAFYYGYKINDTTAVTLAVTTPWGTDTEYPDNWEGQFAAITTQLRTFNFQPVISKMLNEKLAISIGPQIQLAQGTLSSRIPPVPSAGPLGGGLYELEGDNVGVGAVLGLTYMPNEHLTLSLNYNSQIKHNLSGDVTISPQGVDTSASAEIFTPDTLNLGVSHIYNDRWVSHFSFSYTNWSLFNSFDVNDGIVNPSTPQNWQDTYFVALGATFNMNEKWSFRGGASYETSAVENDDRTPRTQDSDRVGLGVGASLKASDSISLDFGYNHIIYLGDIDLITDASNPTNPSGSYDNSVGLVRIGLEYSF